MNLSVSSVNLSLSEYPFSDVNLWNALYFTYGFTANSPTGVENEVLYPK